MAATQKIALKRLMFDLRELQKNPVPNVAATPLEENMFEWHCNIRQDDMILHMILFFPDNYPYSAPSAEFVPTGYNYSQGASRPGKKGTQVCLAMFNDYTDVHSDWKSSKGMGWSPSYTVQSMLMNVVSFLVETRAFSANGLSYQQNLKIAQCCKCEDCGHTFESPFPALCSEETCEMEPGTSTDENTEIEEPVCPDKVDENKKEPEAAEVEEPLPHEPGKDVDMDVCGGADAAFLPPGEDPALDLRRDDSCIDMEVDVSDTDSTDTLHYPHIIDYISKEDFNLEEPTCSGDLFGFGLYIDNDDYCRKGQIILLKSPCEFMSARSFHSMENSVGEVRSVWKQLLKVFLPLHMQPSHGAHIKSEFEKAMLQLATELKLPGGKETPMAEIVLEVFSNLLHTTSLQFASSKGEVYLQGYFALHRLFLWAMETYPDIQAAIDGKVKAFLEDGEIRSKTSCFDLSKLLVLVACSETYRWQDVSGGYLHELWRVWTDQLVHNDPILGCRIIPISKEDRLPRTLEGSKDMRKNFALQVELLNLTHPTNIARKELTQLFDENFGLPSQDMVGKVTEITTRLDAWDWLSFPAWFKLMGEPELSDDEIRTQLIKHVDVNFEEKMNSGDWNGGWWSVLDDYRNHERREKRRKNREERERKKRGSRQQTGRFRMQLRSRVRRLKPRKCNFEQEQTLQPKYLQQGPAFGTRRKVKDWEQGPAFGTRNMMLARVNAS